MAGFHQPEPAPWSPSVCLSTSGTSHDNRLGGFGLPGVSGLGQRQVNLSNQFYVTGNFTFKCPSFSTQSLQDSLYFVLLFSNQLAQFILRVGSCPGLDKHRSLGIGDIVDNAFYLPTRLYLDGN